MNKISRIKRLAFFKKLAQATPATTQTAPTTNQPTQFSFSPSDFNLILGQVDAIKGWGTNRIPNLKSFMTKIDRALNSGTMGKYNFQKLWNNKFPAGAESEFVAPVKDLLVLSRKIYQYVLNNGNIFVQPLMPNEVKARLTALLGAPELQKLEQVNKNSSIGDISLLGTRELLNVIMPQ